MRTDKHRPNTNSGFAGSLPKTTIARRAELTAYCRVPRGRRGYRCRGYAQGLDRVCMLD